MGESIVLNKIYLTHGILTY